MLDGLLLSLQAAGLAGWQGDALGLSSEAVLMNPSDKTLENAARFHADPPKPGLRGRRKHGRLRPPYLSILLAYCEHLYHERSVSKTRGQDSASARALESTAKAFFQTSAACAKVLTKARRLYPELAKLSKGRGMERVESR